MLAIVISSTFSLTRGRRQCARKNNKMCKNNSKFQWKKLVLMVVNVCYQNVIKNPTKGTNS